MCEITQRKMCNTNGYGPKILIYKTLKRRIRGRDTITCKYKHTYSYMVYKNG